MSKQRYTEINLFSEFNELRRMCFNVSDAQLEKYRGELLYKINKWYPNYVKEQKVKAKDKTLKLNEFLLSKYRKNIKSYIRTERFNYYYSELVNILETTLGKPEMNLKHADDILSFKVYNIKNLIFEKLVQDVTNFIKSKSSPYEKRDLEKHKDGFLKLMKDIHTNAKKAKHDLLIVSLK